MNSNKIDLVYWLKKMSPLTNPNLKSIDFLKTIRLTPKKARHRGSNKIKLGKKRKKLINRFLKGRDKRRR